MRIREVCSVDYVKIHNLIVNEMQHSEVSFADMTKWIDIMREDKKIHWLFVAESDNQVVGFISAIKSIGCIDGFFIDITCLVVSESFQGKGVGKELLDFIENLGKTEGITNYSTSSGLHRKEAHVFYEKNNYEKGGYAFYKGLVIVGKD